MIVIQNILPFSSIREIREVFGTAVARACDQIWFKTAVTGGLFLCAVFAVTDSLCPITVFRTSVGISVAF